MKDGVTQFKHSQDFIWAGPLARLGFSGQLRDALESSPCDILHTHGLWMMPNIYPARAAKQTGALLVLAPRGMLDPAALQYSSKIKQAFWRVAQERAAKAVNLFHATSEREVENIRDSGLNQPAAIIPNAIDIPVSVREKSASRLVLSLGRVHPKKGLDRLVKSWAKIEATHPDWTLQIAGPDEGGHTKELEALCKRLGLENVRLTGAVFGEEKWNLLAEAELFVLPTRGENFGMTVAESLAAGTPVISTIGAPWDGLKTHQCGYWIEHGEEPLTDAIDRIISLDYKERENMGRRGRDWMAREYSWDVVAGQMMHSYEWARFGGDCPAFIERGSA